MAWRFGRWEWCGMSFALFIIIGFGTLLEFRTALRRTPMTDLGVFCCAAWATQTGGDLYAISDWHGWHYQYPPALAILFRPLAHPPPPGLPALEPGAVRTEANTPWGYDVPGRSHFFGLHQSNRRFFFIVAAWYLASVTLFLLSVHVVASALEGRNWKTPPPRGPGRRWRWWALRVLPLLLCIGSVGTELSRGQVDIVMLGAMSLALYLAAFCKELRAGLLLSIPASVKLFPPLLLFYPAWRRRWVMSIGVLLGLIIGLTALPAIVLGPKRTVDLYRNWIEVLVKPALGHGSDTSRAAELTGMNTTDNQSLLAFIHNWRYLHLPRGQRPAEAAPTARHTAYAVGGLMILGIALAGGLRRQDSPRQLILLSGLLVGVAFVINPIVHHFYFIMLLPLIAALLDWNLSELATPARRGAIFAALAVFMLIDVLARMPGIGSDMRDVGLPLLSLVTLMGAGAMVLRLSAVPATE